MNDNANRSILIVEDDLLLNTIIYDYLHSAGYVTYQAFSGSDAMRIFNNCDINMVLLDIMMPGIDGWTICQQIRQQSKSLIIIISSLSDERDKLLGFELGADDYVTKPFSPKVLTARIDALFKRIPPVSFQDSIYRYDILKLYIRNRQVLVHDEPVSLTAKEFDLLNLLIKNERTVITRQQIIEHIWGHDYFGDGRVVDTNIKTLRKKLGNAAKYVHTVIGVGYKFEVIS